ncbi:MAG: polysaccharide biosynthesis protein [Clostridia bacterium]|nr:polysaccharide biosynthesis protein [Clostridia bacterium]
MSENTVTKSGNSFLREAVILTIANFAVKIIGVVFKIPLTDILGPSIGVFTAAYSIYAMLFMLSTSGLPVAVSKLVSASNEKGRGAEAKRITYLATLIFGGIGLLCTVALLIFAPDIARLTNHADSALAMRVIAPSLFFVCVCSAIRGHFQGLRNMRPTAISQFIEAFFKFTVGLGAVMYAHAMEASIPVQAACAISGVTVGSVLGTAFTLFYLKFSKKSLPNDTDKERESDKKLLKLIAVVALPVTFTAATLYFSQFLDTLVIVNCLEAAGESKDTADTLFAAYTGLSVPIYDLFPSTLVFPLGISILPTVSAALAVKRNNKAGFLTRQALRISAIIAIPCGVFLFVAGKGCISLIYGAAKWSTPLIMADGSTLLPLDAAANCLAILAVAVFFISIVSISNSLLNAHGKSHLPFIAVLIGIAVLVISEILLLRSPVGIYGAPLSSLICYLAVMFIDLWFIRKYCRVKLSALKMFGRPALCGLISATFTYLAYKGTSLFWSSFISENITGRLPSLVILVVTGTVMVVTYAAALLIFKGITEDEVRLLPKGNWLAGKLLNLGWIKPSAADIED